MLWVALALMTAAAMLCALWPLARRRAGVDGQTRAIEFHKAQLAEIERDVERGLLPASEAAGARAEAARRLIAASEAAKGQGAPSGRSPNRARRAAVVVIFALIPALSLGLYARLGSPSLPDEPILSRAADPAQVSDIGAALAKVEAHLIAHPEDGLGFKVVAPVYMHLARFDEAAKAYAEALRLLGDDAQLRTDYGEALTAEAGGVVTVKAREAFEQALAKQPDLPKARYYVGLAAEQDGDKAKATALFEKMLQDGPSDAPWLGVVRERLAALKGTPPPETAPPPGAAAAIAALDPQAQQQAIRGMVAGLAARLAQNGDDPPGWLRLIRAYCVLHETDKAKQAMADARKAMAGNAAAGRDLDALAQEFGLGS